MKIVISTIVLILSLALASVALADKPNAAAGDPVICEIAGLSVDGHADPHGTGGISSVLFPAQATAKLTTQVCSSASNPCEVPVGSPCDGSICPFGCTNP